MKLIIPFEKKAKFDTKISEISSISLEQEFTKNEGEVLGNFIVSGTYKEYELSVNTLPFKFILPFSLEISDKIDLDSLSLTIDDFTYDLEDSDLNVKIDYIITADDKKEIRFEKVDEPNLDIFDDNLNDDIKESNVINEKDDNEQNYNEKISLQEENILTSIDAKDDYMTYHLHIVTSSETINSICTKYNITQEELLSINNISEINPSDKLLIPINE